MPLPSNLRLSNAAFRVWHAIAAETLRCQAPPHPERITLLTGLSLKAVDYALVELECKGYSLAGTQLLVWPGQYARIVRRSPADFARETPERDVAGVGS